MISRLILSAMLLFSTVAGVKLDDTINVNGQNLVLNGAGIRKKLFIKIKTKNPKWAKGNLNKQPPFMPAIDNILGCVSSTSSGSGSGSGSSSNGCQIKSGVVNRLPSFPACWMAVIGRQKL